MVNIGDTAPDARFATANGSACAQDFAGSKLVLYFYPKDDTSGCTKEAQAFSALAADFAAAGTKVIGISKDTLASHAKFQAKYGLAIDLGSDAEGGVCEAFGTWIEKSMYGRTYMGIERATFLIGTDGKIARIWRKVKVPGHAEEVLEAAKAL